jgi:hypothetical protein
VLDERWFVYGIADDDSLNVRSGPGMENEVIFSLARDADQLGRYGEVVFIGDDRWTPIELGESPGESIGWANLGFLRPMPLVDEPVIVGIVNLDEVTVAAVVEALDDPATLAAFVGPDGVVVATEPAIQGTEEVLTVGDLLGDTSLIRVWGSEPGTGNPIEWSIADYLSAIRGSTALTSTDTIGYGQQIGSGNIPNTIDDAFPDDDWVEFHFAGTIYYAGLDWQSVTLVFDNSGDQLVLRAIVSAAWAP